MPKPYEFIGTIAPHVFPGSAGAVKVLIPKSDMDQARSILKISQDRYEQATKPNLRLVK
jgi:hypothetical protein